MKIVKLNKKNLSKILKLAKKVLTSNGLIIIPTDTVYVLAASAKSNNAVKKLIDFKGRSYGKGISIFLSDYKEIKKYAYYNTNQKVTINTLLPGPFTIVLKSKHKISPEIEAEDKTLGIRMIKHYFVNPLVKKYLFPITATSANISGKGPHYSIPSFLKTLSEKKKAMIDLIIDAGKLPKRPTSTVIRLVKNELEILREGVLNPKLLKKFISKSETATKKTSQKIYFKYFKKLLKNNSVLVILQGNLGSGKTVFSKGIGELFGKNFVSPSFILIDEYKIDKSPLKNIYHLDLWRIENEEELKNLNLKKFLRKGNLLLAEWGEKLSILEQLKKPNIVFFWVRIKETGEKKREIKIYKL